MENKTIGMIIGVTISLILIGTMLMPVLNNVESEVYPTYSNGEKNAVAVGDDDVSITYSATDGLTVDGVSITNYVNMPIIASNTLFVDSVNGKATVMSAVSGAGKILNNVSGFSATITASTSTIALTDITYASGSGDTTLSPDAYEWAFVASNDGEYSAVRTTSTATDHYVANVGEIYGGIFASGSMYAINGNTVYMNGVESDEATTTIDTSAVDGVDNVLQMSLTNSSSTSDILLNYGESSTASINLLILPGEITGTKTSQVASFNLMMVIPMILIVSLLIFGVRTFTKD